MTALGAKFSSRLANYCCIGDRVDKTLDRVLYFIRYDKYYLFFTNNIIKPNTMRCINNAMATPINILEKE